MGALIKAKCKKCGGYVHFDIGEMTVDEAKETLRGHKSWHCNAGNHMELISPIEMYEFDWEHPTENKPKTEEEFEAELKTQFSEVYSSDEFGDKYVVSSFLMGKCLCYPKDGDESDLKVFDFIQSPKGKRFYFLMV